MLFELSSPLGGSVTRATRLAQASSSELLDDANLPRVIAMNLFLLFHVCLFRGNVLHELGDLLLALLIVLLLALFLVLLLALALGLVKHGLACGAKAHVNLGRQHGDSLEHWLQVRGERHVELLERVPARETDMFSLLGRALVLAAKIKRGERHQEVVLSTGDALVALVVLGAAHRTNVPIVVPASLEVCFFLDALLAQVASQFHGSIALLETASPWAAQLLGLELDEGHGSQRLGKKAREKGSK